MYLAQCWRGSARSWELRRTVEEDGQLGCQRLFAMGEDPGRLLHYPGGNAWYIDEQLEERLVALQVPFVYEDLEALLWPFVDPYIRRKVGMFYARGRRAAAGSTRRRPTAAELAKVHAFDRRRLFYLRCARLDAGDLCRLSDKLYAPLCGRCRDEREQLLLAMETELSPREYKQYVFAAFDLGRMFRNSTFAQTMPETLAQEKLDAAFLEAHCALIKDQAFWAGFLPVVGEMDYLARYVIMFFEHEFPSRSQDEEFIRNFIHSRRQYRPPQSKPKVAPERIRELFGQSPEELRGMDRRGLTRLFRERAKKLHPDIGGDHDTFVELTQAYEEFLAMKSG